MADSVTFVAGGTVQAGGGVYIPRQSDQELLALCRGGAFVYVLTPRQMGKSSLMVQTANVLRAQGIRTATVDLTTIGTQLSAEAWYLGLLTTICRQLGLVRQLMQWWHNHQHLGVTQRLTQFIEEVLLAEIPERIVVFVDEIDTTLNLNFTDDFFIAIRSFYLARAEDPKFARLSFVLFGVATPSDLIRNPQRTPFNIGQRVDLTDFTLAEARPLADGFELPPAAAQQLLQWVLDWTGGHPYLTQRLCQTLREENRDRWSEFEVAEVVSRIFFGAASKQDTNLQFVRDMLTRRSPDIAAELTVYREVLRGREAVRDEEQSLVKSHLKLSGVVKRDDEGVLQVRNPIYREVFNLAWVQEHLPINWARRLRRAAVTSGIIFLAATAPLGVIAEMQRQKAVQRGNELEEALADARTAREEAEQARQAEAEQRQLAEAGQQKAETAWRKAQTEREKAETARTEAVAAQQAEAEQRQQAEAAREAEAEQRRRAEVARKAEAEQRQVAEQQKNRAEILRDVALLREKSTQALLRLPSPRAVEGLILAMYSVIESRDLPAAITTDSDILSVVESSLLRASEEAKEQLMLRGHGGEVSAIAVSPNNQLIASGSADNTVQLWNLQGKPVGGAWNHGSPVAAIAFSADSQKITAIGASGSIKQWHVNGTLLAANEATTRFDIASASVSADGQTVAAALMDGSVAVARVSGDRWREWLVHEPELRAVEARLDETDEVIESAARRQDTYSFRGRAGQEIVISMASQAFSPYFLLENAVGEVISDGYFASRMTLPDDGIYRLIASHTGSEVASGAYDLQVSERQYVTPPILQETTARLDENDDSIGGKRRDIYQIEGRSGQEITISMASEDFDTYLELENAAGENIARNDDSGEGTNSLLNIILPADGTYRIIATEFDEGATGFYQLQVSETRLVDPPILQQVAARLEDGDEITQTLIRRGDVYTFEGTAGQPITINMESEDFETYIELQNGTGDAIAQDRSLLEATLPEDDRYRVLATTSGEGSGPYRIVINARPIQGISVSPNGQQLAIALPDGTVQRWDTQGTLLTTSTESHQGAALAVAFSADGQRIVSGGSDRVLRLWDLSGNPIGSPFQGHNGAVLSVDFSNNPEHQRIVSGGQDGTLRLWDWEGNSLGEPLRGHSSEVRSVTFSANDQYIASGGDDRTVRVWDAGDVETQFQVHDSLN